MHTQDKSSSDRGLYGTLLALVVLAITVPQVSPSLHLQVDSVSNNLLRYLVAGLIVLSTCTIMHQLHYASMSGSECGAERRRSRRFMVRAESVLTIVRSTENVPVTLVDISEGGLCAVSQQALPTNTLVSLDLDEHLFLGEVCYCNPLPAGFAIGVRLKHILDQSTVAELVSTLTIRGTLESV